MEGAWIFPFPLRVRDGGFQLYIIKSNRKRYFFAQFCSVDIFFLSCCVVQVRSSVLENVPLQSRKAAVCDGSSLGGQLKAAACAKKVFLNIYHVVLQKPENVRGNIKGSVNCH